MGNVFVLECATPAAVTPLALAIADGDDADGDALSTTEYMSGVVFVTAVLSVVVLTALVVAIRGGLVFRAGPERSVGEGGPTTAGEGRGGPHSGPGAVRAGGR